MRGNSHNSGNPVRLYGRTITEISALSHFKLLAATPSFADRIVAAGSAASILQARLVFSWLAHRSRIGVGASARDICRNTGLHPQTVAEATKGLSGLVECQETGWVALKPPDGLFSPFTPNQSQHWSDHIAYMMFFPPQKGAKITYPETTRRFGVNHAVIWSFLHRKAKDGVVRRFTVAGAAAMFALDEKTVTSVLADLLWLRLIDREDLGRCSDITVLPLTDDHLSLFQQKPESEAKQIEPIAKKPRPAVEPFTYPGDQWDTCRRLCDGLMPQQKAEGAIQKAQRLRDTPEVFEATFRHAKKWHDKNLLSGKVAKGNFGKYLNACFEKRIETAETQEREAARRERIEAYYNSREYRQKRADEEKAAAANPLHPHFEPSQDAVLARVRFDPRQITNIREWDRFGTAINRLIKNFVRGKHLTTQEEVDATGDLRHRILKQALASLNGYYRQPVLATAEQFQTEIDAAIRTVAPGMQLLAPVAPVTDLIPAAPG